jgi:preprotein translocase subunit SecY
MSSELGRRIAFTLGALLIYRIGTYIPLPGIDPTSWEQFFTQAGGILGMFNMFSGGGIRRLAIFALGILPYMTAAVLLQMMTIASSKLRALSQQGYRGRKKIIAYTRYLTIVLVAFQAYGIAIGLEGMHVVTDPGLLFELSTVLTLTGGTLLLIWLADQITVRGFGNGLVLILATGIVASLPSAIVTTLELNRVGALPTNLILAVVVIMVAFVAVIASVEGARRQIFVDYPKRDIGGRIAPAVSAPLSLKLNNAGIIPPLVASWLLLLPAAAVTSFGATGSLGRAIVDQLKHGRPLFMALYAALIVVFTLFYTAFLLDPEAVSKKLNAYGGTVRGIAPGQPTAIYFDDAVSRVTLVGGLYLAIVCLIPEMMISYAAVPFYFGGTSLLFVVCAALDIAAQYKQQVQLQRGGY